MNVVVLPAAIAEAKDVAAWYEARREGLGDEFLTAFELRCRSLVDRARRGRSLKNGLRCARLHRFPYLLYVRENGDCIEVLRCRHTAQRPLR